MYVNVNNFPFYLHYSNFNRTFDLRRRYFAMIKQAKNKKNCFFSCIIHNLIVPLHPQINCTHGCRNGGIGRHEGLKIP